VAEQKKPRRLKKVETVRERAEKSAARPAKPRKLHVAKKTAGKPVRLIGKVLYKLFRPLNFMLKPFRTRPARFVGRILASILLLRFIRDAWGELRQVTWPSKRETGKLALAVFIFAILFGLAIAIVDYGLDKIFRKLLLS